MVFAPRTRPGNAAQSLGTVAFQFTLRTVAGDLRLWQSLCLSRRRGAHPRCLPNGPPWVQEEEAGDYPDGRYELNLQIAVEAGNQGELDKLLARKTRWHMIQMAAILLVALVLMTLVVPLVMHKYGLEANAPPANTAPGVAARSYRPKMNVHL